MGQGSCQTHGIAYVPEDVQLYGNLTALEHLRLFSSLSGAGSPEDVVLLGALSRTNFDLAHAGRPVRWFSKGMRQKVGIAIALSRDAPILLLDEPTSGLDPTDAADLMKLLTSLRDEGKCVFVVTHDLHRSEAVADRVGIMVKGRLLVEWSPRGQSFEHLEDRYRQATSNPMAQLPV